MMEKYRRKRKGRKAGALLLSAVLLGNAAAAPGYAGEVYGDTGTEQAQRIIVGFAELPKEISWQQLPTGAPESAVIFPESLTVTAETAPEPENGERERMTEAPEGAGAGEMTEASTEVPEKVTEALTEAPEDTAEEPEGVGTGEMTEASTEVPGKVTEALTEAPEDTAEVSTEASEKMTEASAEKPEKMTETSAEKPEKVTEMSAEKPEKTTEASAETPEKATEASAEKATEASAEKPEKATEASAETAEKTTEASASIGELLENLVCSVAPITAHAEELETAVTTEEITLTGITWRLLPEKSSGEQFDSGVAPEEYFGVDEDGALKVTEELLENYVDRSGAVYTYVPVLPEQDAQGAAFVLAEGVALPEITVMIGEPMALLAAADTESVEINETNFPDAVFRAYVEREFDKDGDGKLSGSEVAGKDKIYTNQMGGTVNSLKGIEFFPDLDHLACDKSGITELNLKENKKLRLLSCSDTALTELDVSHNPLLQDITFTNSKITSLDVSRNTNLKALLCWDTPIASVNFGEITGLTCIMCQRTNLESLDVSRFADLITLYCDNTGITELDVSNCPKLDTLGCGNTGLTSLNLSNNTALKYLTCGGTSISSLDVGNCPGLRSLSCDNTQITSLDLSKNPEITSLYCHKTPLTSLDVSVLPKLRSMSCYSTQISSLDLSNCPELSSLTCHKTNLTSLDVSKNPKLNDLACSDTQITTLDVRVNRNLTYINCENCPLWYLEIGEDSSIGRINEYGFRPVVNEKEYSFRLADKFPGIDVSRVTIVSGAQLDPDTGILSGYTKGTPVVYNYNCGKLNNKTDKVCKFTLTINGLRDPGEIRFNDDVDLNKTYDGMAVDSTPAVTKNNENGIVTYKWERMNEGNWETIDSAPADAGTYRVTAHMDEDDVYAAADSVSKEFTISQAANSWAQELSMAGWSYGQQANAPSAEAAFGETVYSYSSQADGVFSDQVPTEAGTWYVKAEVVENANYSGLTAVASFEIMKAVATVTGELAPEKTYGDEAFDLGLSAPEGCTLTYEVTEGADVVSVDAAGKVTILHAGDAVILVKASATANYDESLTELRISVKKAAGSGSVSLSNWVYDPDGSAAAPSVSSDTNGTEQVVYYYKVKGAPDSSYTTERPTAAGEYTVKAVFAETADYAETFATADFTIREAEQTESSGTQTESSGTETEKPQTESGGSETENPQTESGGTQTEKPQTESGGTQTENPQTESSGTQTEEPQTEGSGTGTRKPQTGSGEAETEDSETETKKETAGSGETKSTQTSTEKADTPKTGDNSPAEWYFFLLSASAAVLILIAAERRRKGVN